MRWRKAALWSLTVAVCFGLAPLSTDAVATGRLPQTQVSRLSPEDISPSISSLRKNDPGALQRDTRLCTGSVRAQIALGEFERQQNAAATAMTPLSSGVATISLAVMLVTCAVLLGELLRRRLPVAATGKPILPSKEISEISWRSAVTMATLFVLMVWTMLAALSNTPADDHSFALKALGQRLR